MRDEPLPCPFCDNLSVTCYEGSTFRWVFAECDVCGATSGEVRKDTLSEDRDAAQAKAESDAITAWNTRPLRDVGVTDAQPSGIELAHYDAGLLNDRIGDAHAVTVGLSSLTARPNR